MLPPMGSPASTAAAAPRDEEAVQARYRDNAARHLIGVARDLAVRVMRRLTDERGYEDLRPSFGPFLSLVALEPRPLSAIAGQLAISKQACSQLANLTEQAGYVTREVDRRDRRARVVTLSPRGRQLVADAAEIIQETEAEYAALVGAAAYRRFTRSLARLFRGLGIPTHEDAGRSADAARSIGVLPLIAVRVQQDLMSGTTERGHAGLKMSHAQVLPLIGPDGARVSVLSRLQGVSRQAISATARDLESLGYVERARDPHDGRGVVLRLTDQGRALIRDSVHALDALERVCLRLLGQRGVDELRRVARQLYRALHLEEEIFSTSAADAADDAPDAERRQEIHGLATSLRRRLGSRDAARLAALLEDSKERTET